MIKALIVDDEKLVRKGIISVFPWEQYQIEIVGEAGNGEAALKLLGEIAADLIFVDLTMPIMGGIEMMKIVRERFPDTSMVVLTCHQDFNYIQEAMRLGAIDYIVKTQLEQETIEDALNRISSRIVKEKQNRLLVPSDANNDQQISGHVLIGKDTDDFPFNFLEPDSVFQINEGIWFISSMISRDIYNQAQSFITSRDNWIWLDIQGMKEESSSAFYAKLRTLVPLFLFYKLQPGQRAGELPLHNVAAQRGKLAEEWIMLEEKWLNMRWIYEEDEFLALIDKTAQLMPDQSKMTHLLSGIFTPWLSIIQSELVRERLQSIESFPLWNLWVSWMQTGRSHIQTEMKRHSYAAEVVVNLVRAIRHIQLTNDYRFSRDELAAKYLMSGSHFSQCFKDIVNKAYGEYVKEIRLNKAVQLLQESNLPIYQVAEQTGFLDEKYFSKLFRNHFGHNPQDYRKQWIASNGEKV